MKMNLFKFSRKKKAPQIQAPVPQPKLSFGPPEITARDILYDPVNDIIGVGSYGTVYKGKCRGMEVAVKTPLKQTLTDDQMQSFKHEVEMMSNIYHPNVVMLMGACTEKGKLHIVTERCKTNLETLLASNTPLSMYERMRMARDAALGMDWLHSVTKMVHRDLKPANLLIDFNNRVKVADFGFCQVKNELLPNEIPKGTLMWMAPEVMLREQYTEKIDVYSFGIILWEIATRKKPFPHYAEPFIFCSAICHGKERPTIPADIPERLKYLMSICWRHNPKERCSFDEVVFILSEVMVDCAIEIKSAANFWKKYFLEPKMELFEKVPWPEFLSAVVRELNIPRDDISFESLKKILATTEENMGEPVDFVAMERFDKVVKIFGPFFDAMEGQRTLAEIHRLMDQNWFHGDISFLVANSRLARHGEGAFLIRLSSSDPRKTPFTLSVAGDRHFRIERAPGGFVAQGRTYTSLHDIVEKNSHLLRRACPKDYVAYSDAADE